MAVRPENPLIVQSDHTVLLEVDGPRAADARDALAPFTELVKSPEHIHTYRITPLSIWNAAAAGHDAARMKETLTGFAKYPVPQNVLRDVEDYAARYGRVRLEKEGDELVLRSDDPAVLVEAWGASAVRKCLLERRSAHEATVDPGMRGHVKQAMIRLGHPVEDLAGYVQGGALSIELDEGGDFAMRGYQTAAVDAFWAGGSARGGSGVVVLPCGAGKTVVGMGAMARAGCKTLILTTNLTAVRQWQRELVEKCRIDPEDVGEYTGERKEIRAVTVTTYQILTYRRARTEPFTHLGLFSDHDWGLIVYDEVHLLPAPVFRVTAEIQARRRLGLTATLVREDGREDEVFSLIGPKKYDVPWKILERQGWIAAAHCTEVRLPLDPGRGIEYMSASSRDQFRIASENPDKLPVVQRLVARHGDDRVLIYGLDVDDPKAIQGTTKGLLEEFGQDVVGEAAQWKAQAAEFLGVDEAAGAIVLEHQVVALEHVPATHGLGVGEAIADDLEHELVRFEGEHGHHHALAARRHDERVRGTLQVAEELPVALGLALLGASQGRVELGNGLVGHEFAQVDDRFGHLLEVGVEVGARVAVEHADDAQRTNKVHQVVSTMRADRIANPNDSVAAHFQQHAGQDHRDRSRRFDVRVR